MISSATNGLQIAKSSKLSRYFQILWISSILYIDFPVLEINLVISDTLSNYNFRLGVQIFLVWAVRKRGLTSLFAFMGRGQAGKARLGAGRGREEQGCKDTIAAVRSQPRPIHAYRHPPLLN